MANPGSNRSVSQVARLGGLDVFLVEHPPARKGMAANAYILTQGAEWAVIDSGWSGPSGAQIWDDAVAGLGLRWPELKSVWITHAHPDHLGQARHLFERSGCIPAMHPEALSEFERARDMPSTGVESEFATLMIRAGMTVSEVAAISSPFADYGRIALPPSFLPLLETETISFGGETFQPILSPGHCHGHICLWHASTGTLFAGDTVIPDGFPPIVVMPGTSDNPMSAYFGTLEQLRALKADLFLSGHGAPLSQPNARLDETVIFHQGHIDSIVRMLSAEPLSAAAIAAALEHRKIPFAALSNFGKVLVLTEIVAYLHYLVAEGRIVADQREASGSLRYCPRSRDGLSKKTSQEPDE